VTKTKRLDVRVHELGLAESREQAKRLILAGEVLVDGQLVDRAAALVSLEAQIEVKARPPYVSRGGLKLEHALDLFGIGMRGCVAADLGASTGGFTDCMLQRGAERVYAVDVGYGQLHWSLRQDPRVVVMERVNARYLERLPEPVDMVTIDASFISLRLLLPTAARLLKPDGTVLALIKPQFEAGARLVGKGGVVRKAGVHRLVLRRVIEGALAAGWTLRGLTRSPITGPKGNVEFLVWLDSSRLTNGLSPEAAIEAVL
jgi:23S rRNA (cytidine1920-2'-O)/16S rRNA (cytidine1409-2'-O)-methyltransferase